MNGRFNTSFPRTNIPDKDKNEEWHKKFVRAIINDSTGNNYTTIHSLIDQNYQYYDGTQSDEAFRFLQETYGGESLPAQWINYQNIKNKIDVLLGELSQKGYKIDARAINKEASVRKLDKKYEILGKMAVQDDLQEIEDMTGLPVGIREELPKDIQELDDYINNTYKDVSEHVMTSALKYLIKRYKWDYERLALFRDMLIAGRCFCKMEMVNGVPRWRRVDPRLMVYDAYSDDDFLTEATYFGEMRYMPLAEATQEFQLSKEEVEKIQNSKSSPESAMGNSLLYESNTGETSIRYIEGSKNNLKILVFTGYWMDTKPMKYKVTTDRFGNEHVKRIPNGEKVKKKDEKNIITKKAKIWRQCTLLGGIIAKDWGVMPNMIRSVDDISETKPPFVAVIPNNQNFRGISIVDQLRTLQDLKNISMYNVQLAMSRAGAKGFVYDVAQCPDEYTPEEVIKYIKLAGIAFINSKKDGVPSTYTAFSEFDQTLSASVNQYISIAQYVDAQMESISGVNQSRLGQVQGASQAVGVTQNSLIQSALTTETKFKEFRMFCEEVMTRAAEMTKLTWGETAFWPYVLGDAGVDFLNLDIDMSLNDYGCFIEELPMLIDDKMAFKQTLDIALQQGAIDLIQYLDLATEHDVETAINRLKRDIKEKEKNSQQQQMEMMQMQQQQAMELQESQNQADMQKMMAEERFQGERQSMVEDERNQNRKSDLILKEYLEKIGKPPPGME